MTHKSRQQDQDREPRRMVPSNLAGCKRWGTLLWLLLLAAMAFSVWSFFGEGLGQATEISFSAFRQQIQDGNVSRVIVEQS